MKLIIHRSKGLLAYLIVVHVLAVTLVLLLSLQLSITAGLLLILFFSLALSCQRYGWLSREAVIHELTLDGDGRWYLNSRQRTKTVWQLERSVILGPLIFLHFRSRKKRSLKSVVLAQDAVDRESWRQLCLKLRDPETWDE